jgi:hypothetical protein
MRGVTLIERVLQSRSPVRVLGRAVNRPVSPARQRLTMRNRMATSQLSSSAPGVKAPLLPYGSTWLRNSARSIVSMALHAVASCRGQALDHLHLRPFLPPFTIPNRPCWGAMGGGATRCADRLGWAVVGRTHAKSTRVRSMESTRPHRFPATEDSVIGMPCTSTPRHYPSVDIQRPAAVRRFALCVS